MNHTRRIVLVPENTMERLQQRQQILTPPITQSSKNLDTEMSDILTSKRLDYEEQTRTYNHVLQVYRTYYNQRKGQPLNVTIAAQPITKSEATVELSKPENSKDSLRLEIPEAITAAVEQEVRDL